MQHSVQVISPHDFRLLSLPCVVAVQASITANTYVVSGSAETKSMQDLMPNILSQLGPNAIQSLLASMQKGGKGGIEQMLAGLGGLGGAGGDDMPELEENFEDVSKE